MNKINKICIVFCFSFTGEEVPINAIEEELKRNPRLCLPVGLLL
jgi:hypothetical protein